MKAGMTPFQLGVHRAQDGDSAGHTFILSTELRPLVDAIDLNNIDLRDVESLFALKQANPYGGTGALPTDAEVLEFNSYGEGEPTDEARDVANLGLDRIFGQRVFHAPWYSAYERARDGATKAKTPGGRLFTGPEMQAYLDSLGEDRSQIDPFEVPELTRVLRWGSARFSDAQAFEQPDGNPQEMTLEARQLIVEYLERLFR
jgi:hypothetical protein